jgi:hypothetical protein
LIKRWDIPLSPPLCGERCYGAGGENSAPSLLSNPRWSAPCPNLSIYDIRGEVVGETGVATLAERNPIVVRSQGAFSGRVPADWRERFNDAFDAEFREWLAAAAEGGAAGPSAWDGYVATATSEAALEALRSGKRVEIRLREKPALYG